MNEIEAQAELLRLREQTNALQVEKEHFKHLLEMEERGRRLIGYDIHDGLAQLLAGAMLELSNFERLMTEDQDRAWKSFDCGVSFVAQSLREARRLIHGLEPSELEENGIVAAIEDLVSDINDQSEQQVEFLCTMFDSTGYRRQWNIRSSELSKRAWPMPDATARATEYGSS